MTTIRYLFSIFVLILKGIASAVFASAGFLFLSLGMGTGGPSLIFIINFGIQVALLVIALLCFYLGVCIWTTKWKIDWWKTKCHICY